MGARAHLKTELEQRALDLGHVEAAVGITVVRVKGALGTACELVEQVELECELEDFVSVDALLSVALVPLDDDRNLPKRLGQSEFEERVAQVRCVEGARPRALMPPEDRLSAQSRLGPKLRHGQHRLGTPAARRGSAAAAATSPVALGVAPGVLRTQIANELAKGVETDAHLAFSTGVHAALQQPLGGGAHLEARHHVRHRGAQLLAAVLDRDAAQRLVAVQAKRTVDLGCDQMTELLVNRFVNRRRLRPRGWRRTGQSRSDPVHRHEGRSKDDLCGCGLGGANLQRGQALHAALEPNGPLRRRCGQSGR